MASAIDKAIAKLDAILLAAAGVAPAATAAPSKPAAIPPVPSASELSDTSSSRPGSSVNVAAAASAGPAARQILATKAQIKVARITSAVAQPNSAKLLKLQADLGEGDQRQIMAGLQQYYQPADLVGRLVVVASNLKPAKLAGEASQAMVMAAEAAGGPEGQLTVKVINPPENACPGDLVHLDGVMPPESYPKVLKLDEWRQVVPGLVVAAGGKATFEGTPLVTAQGLVTVPAEIPDGSEIH